MYDEDAYDNDFIAVQEKLADFLSKQKRALTTKQIKKKFGERFLGDALQVLKTTGRVTVSGGVMLPRYRYATSPVKQEMEKHCYHCGNRRGVSDFIDETTGKPAKICSSCRAYSQRQIARLQKGKR